MTKDQIKILHRIIEKWGRKPQQAMIVEECAELIQAIQKYERTVLDTNCNMDDMSRRLSDIQSEIADVYIMIHQAIIMFGEDGVMKQVDYKLNRILPRL